jgi:3',5'-cyclic AMP phosphodiesterase CpdA
LIIASDIHVSKVAPQAVERLRQACLDDSHRVLILAGDLTQRGRDWEYRWMRHFVSALLADGVRVICTPGNHDVSLSAGYLPSFRSKRRDRYLQSVVELLAHQRGVVSCRGFDMLMDLGEHVLLSLRSTHRRGKAFRGNRIDRRQLAWARDHLSALDAPRRRQVHLITHHSYWRQQGDRHGHLSKRHRLARMLLVPFSVSTFINGHNHRFVAEQAPLGRRRKERIMHIQAPTLSRRTKGQSGFVRWDPDAKDSAELVLID